MSSPVLGILLSSISLCIQVPTQDTSTLMSNSPLQICVSQITLLISIFRALFSPVLFHILVKTHPVPKHESFGFIHELFPFPAHEICLAPYSLCMRSSPAPHC